MKKLLTEIVNYDTPALTHVIKYWKDYNPNSVIMAYIELQRRDFNLDGLEKKIDTFCKTYSLSNIEETITDKISDYKNISAEKYTQKVKELEMGEMFISNDIINNKLQITINNNEKLFLIVAIIGFISFFLPWFGSGYTGNASGYDIMTFGKKMGENKTWILLLLPISFLIITLAKLQIIKNINPILLKIIELIPIILILFIFIKLFDESGIRMNDFGKIDGEFLRIFKIGFPLTLLSSIIIIFSPLSKYTTLIY